MADHAARLGAGIVVGGLLAFGASVASREIMRRAGTTLIDWEAVREIAHRRLGSARGPDPAGQRAEAEAFYRATLLRIEPIVAEEIGSQLPEALEIPAVVDRLEWVDLNLATFSVLFERIERRCWPARRARTPPGRAMSRWLNRTVGNQQLGFMLAFLGRKVLGQYDVSLLAAGPDARGRLNFVEPNIVGHGRHHAASRATSSAPSSPSTRRLTPSSSRPPVAAAVLRRPRWPRRSSSWRPSPAG